MSYESVKLGCLLCSHVHEDLIDRKDRDCAFTCPACGEQSMRRMLAAPNVRTRTSATYIDGTKRFGTVKETNQLKRMRSYAKQSNDAEKVARINKELDKIGGK